MGQESRLQARFTRREVVAVKLAFGFFLLSGVALTAQEPVCADCHDADPALAESVHAFLDCGDCHAGLTEESHPDQTPEPACADCHEDAVSEFEGSVHGRLRRAGEEFWISSCSSCHGAIHGLPPSTDPASPVHHARLASTCGACHSDPQMAHRYRFRLVQPEAAYLASVHARAVAEGRGGASCSDCHGSHAILSGSDPESDVYHRKVPETCGRCHGEITETYRQSVHGQAAAHGIRESPVCTDCHGEHRILSPVEKGSPVYATNIPKQTCGRCHSDLRLSEKFGMPGDKVPAYADSYHGLAARAGTVTVAHCASCHGIHDILPSSDPASHIHRDNLAATCGTCHPGAGRTFGIGPVHVLPTEVEHAAIYWVRYFYLWLIALVVGGMVLHNGLDFVRKVRLPPLRPAPAPTGPERMSAAFRLAHGLLAASFIVLVYTGFALKYPEAWWSEPLLHWESQFGLRGWLHRAAAVVMLLACALHLAHLASSRQARACLAAMRPSRRDWEELRERIAYYFGRRKEPPLAAWVAYPEKLEYLAIIWGTVIMAVSGFLLWFENLALTWLPKWVIDVATVVHFYEAVLAALAILVWHFYAVIFDPVVYPMDPAWITGRSAPGREAEREPPEPHSEPEAPGRRRQRQPRTA